MHKHKHATVKADNLNWRKKSSEKSLIRYKG